jgi:ABC-type lipoprotein release transport system permease subunit
MRPAIFGLVMGRAASLETGWIGDLLYEIKPLDPEVFDAVVATLLAVSVFACTVPAWRASRLDPMQASRAE